MIAVSDEFKRAIEQNTRSYEWSGSIQTKSGKTYDFTSKNIVKGSGYVKWQCCSNSEIELGSVYSAEMGISLFSEIDRYTLYDAIVRLYFTLKLESGESETIPMGVFEISEANRKVKTLELKGYDYMLRFDKHLKLESSSGTAYQFLKTACTVCKVEMAQSAAEINAMPNGKQTLGIYADNDIETYRDLIYYVAQVLGGFCQIDRYGRLVIRHYDNVPVWTVPQEARFSSSYSDFVTRYTAVSSTNITTNISEYIAEEVDDALTMNLGINPLMQFGIKSIREKILRNILSALGKVDYLPFESSTIGNPALEPGDVIVCTGGHADDSKISCVTSVEYKINGKTTVKCVGKNPRMFAVKSKNDKNIAGLLNTVVNGKTVFYSFVNVAALDIGASLMKVMDIDFTATEETSACFQCQMLIEVEKKSSNGTDLPELCVVYKMNGETIDNFMPTKTCMYGKHIMNLFYPFSKVIENSSNTFSVYMKISDGRVKINEAQIRATISGQGLAAGLGDWNGRININEDIGLITMKTDGIIIAPFDERVVCGYLPHKKNDIVQQTGGIIIPSSVISIGAFAERLWFAEIVRTFVLDSLRGKPAYGKYITLNTNDSFALVKNYALDSQPLSMERGFAEELNVDTEFLVGVDNVEVICHSPGRRQQLLLDSRSTQAKYSDMVDTANGVFELKCMEQTVKTAEQAEIDEGYMTCVCVDASDYDGIKNVRYMI